MPGRLGARMTGIPTMSPTATHLANALLAHHRAVCVPHVSRPPVVDACVIPYGDLWTRIGRPDDLVTIGGYLKEIAAWCAAQGWPPLNSLAVNGRKRRPGTRYSQAPGCSLETWEAEASACILFRRYPESAPTPD